MYILPRTLMTEASGTKQEYKAVKTQPEQHETVGTRVGTRTEHFPDFLSTQGGAENAFTALKALAQHLDRSFHASLLFVSCRAPEPSGPLTFPYDRMRTDEAIARNRLYQMATPVDVAVSSLGHPVVWLGQSRANDNGHPLAQIDSSIDDTVIGDLLLIPLSLQSHTLLAAVRSPSAHHDELTTCIAAHCLQFLAANFNKIAPRSKTMKALLSPQENRVMQHCAAGLTDKEIAIELSISPHTVRAHLNNAKEKFKARNKTHAAVIYRSEMLLVDDTAPHGETSSGPRDQGE